MTTRAVNQQPSTSTKRAGLVAMFERLDTQGDGKVTHNELLRVFEDVGHCKHSSVDELMKEADTNNDGAIDYDEFSAWLFAPSSNKELVKLVLKGSKPGDVRQANPSLNQSEVVCPSLSLPLSRCTEPPSPPPRPSTPPPRPRPVAVKRFRTRTSLENHQLHMHACELANALAHENSDVRTGALRALGDLADDLVEPHARVIAHVATDDADVAVRREAARVLPSCGEAVERSGSITESLVLAARVSPTATDPTKTHLVEALEDKDVHVRAVAAQALLIGKSDGDDVLEDFLSNAEDELSFRSHFAQWYPVGKYQHAGKDVVKIVKSTFENSQLEFQIIYTDCTYRKTRMDDPSTPDAQRKIEYINDLIKDLGFVRMEIVDDAMRDFVLCGANDGAGVIAWEAVPPEQPGSGFEMIAQRSDSSSRRRDSEDINVDLLHSHETEIDLTMPGFTWLLKAASPATNSANFATWRRV